MVRIDAQTSVHEHSELILANFSMLTSGWPAHARASTAPGTHQAPAGDHVLIAPPAQQAAVRRDLDALRKRRLHLRRGWYLQVLKGRPPSRLINTDATSKILVPLPESLHVARTIQASTAQIANRQVLKATYNSSQALGLKADPKAGQESAQQAETTKQSQRSRQQQHQRQQQVALPIDQQLRLRLFGGTPILPGAGSPSLRYAFIPKVASCTRWRPRLAHRLLPKFLPSLDGPCTAFLLRHLVKLQPAEHRALHNLMRAAKPRAGGWLHMRLYLQQPLQGPGVWPAAQFLSLQLTQGRRPSQDAGLQTVAHMSNHRSDAVSRRSQTMRAVRAECTERFQFECLVRSVCMVSIRKLHMFSGSKLAACVAAVGDLHMRLPARFWKVWEVATMSLLPGSSSQEITLAKAALDTLMPANSMPEAEGTQVAKVVSSTTAQPSNSPAHVTEHAGPGTTAAQVRMMKAGQLCSLAAGMGRCRYVPSHAWQSAFYTALQQALQDDMLQLSQLGLLLEGWALLCMETSQHLSRQRCTGKQRAGKSKASKRGQAKQDAGKGNWRGVKGHVWAPPAQLLKEVCMQLQARVQADPRPSEVPPRFVTAALLACAAQAHLQAHWQHDVHCVGAMTPAAPDMQRMLDCASWWLTTSHPWLHSPNTKLSGAQVAAALWALGVLVDICTTRDSSTASPSLQAHATTAVAAPLRAGAAAPPTEGSWPAGQLAGTGPTASAAADVVAAAHRWASRAVCLQMRPTAARTAHLVHATLVGMRRLQCTPKPDVVQQCLAAVAESLPELTVLQVVDCITVLAAWGARPAPGWAASLSVWLLLHAHNLTNISLVQLLRALCSMHVRLSPACTLHALQLLQSYPQISGRHQSQHGRLSALQ